MSEVDTLTSEELREQAKIMGISLRGNPSDETLREKLRAALGEDITPSVDEAKSKAKGNDWVTITIHEDPNNKQPVFVGVNGKSYRIKRGVPVSVPRAVVENLNDAVRVEYYQDEDRNRIARKVPAYPFSVHAA